MEDIKYLENKIENNLVLSRHNPRDYQAIKNIIARNKELEQKYSNELDEGLKMSEWLVEKQKKIEEQEKMIDLMAEFIEVAELDEDISKAYCLNENCKDINSFNCLKCIKEHFKKKASEEK